MHKISVQERDTTHRPQVLNVQLGVTNRKGYIFLSEPILQASWLNSMRHATYYWMTEIYINIDNQA